MKKLVIELDEKFYKYVCEEVKSDELVYQAIQNGTPLEEELEKLKAKISMTNGCGDFIATSDVETLIDTRIKELKGENK